MASSFKANFSDLYRSAFAETDQQVKQLLLREVQGVLDSWFFEEHTQRLGIALACDSTSRVETPAAASRPHT